MSETGTTGTDDQERAARRSPGAGCSSSGWRPSRRCAARGCCPAARRRAAPTTRGAAEPAPTAPGHAGYDPSAHSWAFVIDTTTCIGCGRCVEACKLENHVPEEPEINRTWVELHVLDRGRERPRHVARRRPQRASRPRAEPVAPGADRHGTPTSCRALCMQCENPPCTWVCPVSATFRDRGRGRPRGREPLHRLRLLHRRLPVRRPLHGPRRRDHAEGRPGRRRQVHVLLPPDHPRPAAGVRRGLPGRTPGSSATSTTRPAR